MAQNQNPESGSSADNTSKLLSRIKELEEQLLLAKAKESSAMEVAYDINRQFHALRQSYNEVVARNKELEDPQGQLDSNGLGWLSKVVQVIRRVGRPLRSQEIMHELRATDKEKLLQWISNPENYVSVVLAKGVKSKRLKKYKVAGTRGSYYALEEWIDKDGNLNDEMKNKLL